MSLVYSRAIHLDSLSNKFLST